MDAGTTVPDIGVEEEFVLVEAESGRPALRVSEVLADAHRLAGEYTGPELHRAQIETASEPCASLAELAEQLTEQRRLVGQAASEHGVRVLATGTYPGKMGEAGRLITENARYKEMAAANPLIAREQLICGCHVHVAVADDRARIDVVNRIRRYLHCLVALAANSPFWEGEDSGFASFRNEVWSRWPSAGPPGAFDDPSQYRSLVEQLVSAGVILDEGMVYWDVRLSRRYPTIEVRIADVGLTVADAVTVAGLTRALVMDCLRAEEPLPDLRPELLKAASWNAARAGTGGDLLDPAEGVAAPIREYLSELLARLAPVLSASGDGDLVNEGIQRILVSGNGADRQRAAAAAGGLPAVIEVAAIRP